MTVRTMHADELALVLDWAADEGWNPGLDDAGCFYAADPGGFFLKEVEGRPAAAVSVVNHDDRFAFLGLYICHPEFRGSGYGLEVWNAGLAHAGNRSIGLDGVPEQQKNYEASGFARYGETVRYRGKTASVGAHSQFAMTLDNLMAADRDATGLLRGRFSSAWFTDSANRRTVCLSPTAFATFRKCREGVKIGPFHADTLDEARTLLMQTPVEFGDGPRYIDVPHLSSAFADLLRQLDFKPVFSTARMFSAAAPIQLLPPFYGVASLELG